MARWPRTRTGSTAADAVRDAVPTGSAMRRGSDKTVRELERELRQNHGDGWPIRAFVERIRQDGQIIEPTPDHAHLQEDAVLAIAGRREWFSPAEPIGKEVDDRELLDSRSTALDVVVTSKELPRRKLSLRNRARISSEDWARGVLRAEGRAQRRRDAADARDCSSTAATPSRSSASQGGRGACGGRRSVTPIVPTEADRHGRDGHRHRDWGPSRRPRPSRSAACR